MKKIIVHHRSSHHSGYSGYSKLVDYLDDVEVVSGYPNLPYKVAKFIKNRNNQDYGIYDTVSVFKNYELIKKKIFSNENYLVHYLNGERDIRQAILFGKNNVATFHKPPAVLESTILNTKYLKKLNGAIAVGTSQVEFLKNWLEIENVKFIPHGINTDFFVPNSSKKKEKTILFVGQHLRNFDVLNHVIRTLSEKIPDIRFNIVLRKDFAKNIITNSSVTIYSGIDDKNLKQLYQEATVLFLPLIDVTACNSLLEAMSCGLPIITTNLESNKGYGLNPANSILVEGNNYIDYVEAILSMLTSSESVLNEYSISLRENASHFDWQIVANRINDFYEML